MRMLTLVRTELARLTSSRMGLLALVALMVVPVVYGGLYLYGNADPYNQLDKVPAAVVVDDTGDYGRDAADTLLDDQRFGWVLVDDSEAERGVEDGTYDFSLTFPRSFSDDLESAGGDDPVQASLVLTTNDTNSYLSTTLAKQAAAAVQVAIAQQVGEHASRTLLDAVDSIRTGLVNADEGAATLADATVTAAQGAEALAAGSSTLASGAASLSSGLAELDSRASALPGSASTLAGGASTVAAGAAQAAALAPGIRTQLAGIFATSDVSPADQATILGELDALSGSLGRLSGGASQVASGASALSSLLPVLLVLRLIARASEGSVRDALSLADQAIAHGAGHVGADAVRDMLGLADRARVIDLFEMLMVGDASAAAATAAYPTASRRETTSDSSPSASSPRPQ